MNKNTIKILALTAMLLDHIALIILTPGIEGGGHILETLHLSLSAAVILRRLFLSVGSMTGAVMIYFVIEGYHYTGNRKKYLLSKKDPTGPKDPPAKNPSKVLRGGYYLSSPASCRSCARSSNGPATDWEEFGFRFIMARTADKD